MYTLADELVPAGGFNKDSISTYRVHLITQYSTPHTTRTTTISGTTITLLTCHLVGEYSLPVLYHNVVLCPVQGFVFHGSRR